MKRLLIAALVVVAGVAVQATTVRRIVIISTTTQEVSKQMVRSNIKLREGAPFNRGRLSEDIKRLYATGQLYDIETKVTEVGDGQEVDVTFRLTPNPRVEEVVFNGNDRLSDRKLRRKTEQKAGEILNEKTVAADLRALYDLYTRKGYKAAVIRQNLERDPKSQSVNVVYEIEEKGRHKTREVAFEGNTAFSERKLRRKMKTRVSFWGRMFPVGFFDEAALQRDLGELKIRYQDAGYLDFKVDKVERSYNDEGNLLYLTIHVTEGEPYTVSSVEVTGHDAFDKAAVSEKVRLKAEQRYSRATETADIEAIKKMYNREGYLDSRIRAELVPDTAAHRVAVTYTIREGEASSIRNVNIAGNTITKDHVIRRELQIHPGDKSDIDRIELSKSRLMNLGYFESVDAVPVSTEEVDEKDLNIKVTEKPTGRLLLSAGFSSSSDLIAGVEVAQTNFDIGDWPTLRGGGQRARARAQVGTSRSDLVLSFTEPWLFDRPLRLDADLWHRTVSSNRGWDQTGTGGSLALTTQLPWRFWRLRYGYRLENIDIDDIDEDYSDAFIEAEEETNLVSAILLGVSRDRRDRLIRTSRGSRVSLTGELQAEGIGSYTNLYKLTLSGDKYFPLPHGLVLQFSGKVGLVDAMSGDEPGVFDRLFTGGSGSVRGFDEREVGPIDRVYEQRMLNGAPVLDGNGDPIYDQVGSEEPVGGQSILLASVELVTPVYQDKVYWALFADAGNVWAGSTEWNPGEMNVGVGMGLRLFLPIGMVSLDYGYPVVREQDHLGENGRLHFNIGYGF